MGKITKFLAPVRMKVELLTATTCLEYASFETNKIYDYKIRFFFHVYKVTTYLASLAKSPNKIPLFIVSR